MRQTQTRSVNRSAIVKPSDPIPVESLNIKFGLWSAELAEERVKPHPRPEVIERLECRVHIVEQILQKGRCLPEEVHKLGRFTQHLIENTLTLIRVLLSNWSRGYSKAAV